jgi:ketosteroid isomerase-like protein
MGEADNVRAVERLVAGLNAKDVEVMNEVFVDDSVLSWPQSGEIIRGRENRQGVYGRSRRSRRSPLTGPSRRATW